MITYLPEDLDIDQHLEKYPPSNIARFAKDKLVYLLSLIISIPAKNKSIFKELKGWAPIYTPIVRDKVKNYSSYMRYALGGDYPDDPGAQIIISDQHYIPGEKSKYFRFISRYSASEGVVPMQITDKKLIGILHKERLKKNKEAESLYPYLTQWFSGLEIDGEAARGYALALRDEELQNICIDELLSRHEVEEVEARKGVAHLKYMCYLYNINSIEKGEFYYTVDTTAMRLHSNITNLKREFRNFLTYKGESLVSIDIKNAQPFFSLALFKKQFFLEPTEGQNKDRLKKELSSKGSFMSLRYSRSFQLSAVAPELYEKMVTTMVNVPLGKPKKPGGKIIKHITTSKVNSVIMYSESLEFADNEDVNNYKDSVVKGVFYDEFVDAVNRNFNLEWKRKDAKSAMFRVFFTDNRFMNEPKQLFRSMYPSVYESFRRLKDKGKNALAVLLQSIESWLVLDVVCKKINRDNSRVPIFTIHDNIVTTKKNEELVTRVLESEIARIIGHKPALDKADLCPHNLFAEQVGDELVNEALSILSSQNVY